MPDLSTLAPRYRWLLLAALSAVFMTVLGLVRLPANLLLGAMSAGILVALCGGKVKIPVPVFFAAQSLVGCLIARSISLPVLKDILKNWPLFILMVVSVSVVATFLGWLLAKTKTLPGTTAIWGTSPGAALVMTLMSESYGADSRLVAFMQYFRVLLVTVAATLVARIWGEPIGVREVATAAAAFDWLGLAETLAVASCGILLGIYGRIKPAPILFPLIVGSVLNVTDVIHITLPWWLLAAAYCVIGWGIGVRFDRPIVAHAFRAFPMIAATIFTMILVCGCFAVFIGYVIGVDPMTAYLATSPGGMDSVAIIAASTGGNMSFVMAVQTTRFILVTATSPGIATFVVKRTGLWNKDQTA